MKLCFYADEPGGANVLIPLIQKTDQVHSIKVYANPISAKQFLKWGIASETVILHTLEEAMKLLTSFGPDRIITGAGGATNSEKWLWIAGRNLGVLSFAIVDQAINMGVRFHQKGILFESLGVMQREEFIFPDVVFLPEPDDFVQKFAPAFFVTGNPYLELLATMPQKNKMEKGRILFVSEPRSDDFDKTGQTAKERFGYDECEIINFLLDAMDRRDSLYRLYIRKHPRENWCQKINKIKSSKVGWQWDTDDSFTSIQKSEFVLGMSSSMLIESLFLGKKVLSIQIGSQAHHGIDKEKENLIFTVKTKEALDEVIEHLDGFQNKVSKVVPPIGSGAVILREILR